MAGVPCPEEFQDGVAARQILHGRIEERQEHLAFMLVVFAPRRGLTLLRSTRPLLQVSRSTLFCVSTFGMFYALGFVPLTAAAVSFTAPLIVTALAPFALGERVGAARAIAVGVGFLGAMVVVRPGLGGVSLGCVF